MAEKTTVARPYAQAMFEVAKGQSKLAETSEVLQLAAAVVIDESFSSLIGTPNVDKGRLADLVIGVIGDRATLENGNFIKMLAENDRLNVLPEVAELFDAYRADEERTVVAEVVSARKLTDKHKKEIVESLKTRLGREVTLTCSIDKALIGGAIIRAGDLVIDGSVTAQLNKLSTALSR